MTEGKRYTLAEAREELAREECALRGHSYEIIWVMGGEPEMLVCSRCGRKWAVEAV